MENLLTVKEAAAFLRVHVQTVYDWIYKGRIKASRFGTGSRVVNRISSEELERFCNSKNVKTESK